MDIAGTRALVTGASGGIGAAVATALHERGATVLLHGRRHGALAALADALPGAEVVTADLADAGDVASLAERAADVDLAVHAAALPGTGLLTELDAGEAQRVLAVNLHAPIALTHALLPGMLARGQGHSVFVSSVSGRLATRRMSLYAASKFGLRGFAAGLRRDLAGSPVGASCVLPGPIADAGMWVEAGVEPPQVPRPRRAADVAAAVVRAVERDCAEILVWRASARPALVLGDVAPDLLGRLLDRGGADAQAAAYAEGSARRLDG